MVKKKELTVFRSDYWTHYSQNTNFRLVLQIIKRELRDNQYLIFYLLSAETAEIYLCFQMSRPLNPQHPSARLEKQSSRPPRHVEPARVKYDGGLSNGGEN